jgi:hypothetical protein
MLPRRLFVETQFELEIDQELAPWAFWKEDLPVPPLWDAIDDYERSAWQSRTQALRVSLAIDKRLGVVPSNSGIMIGDVDDRDFVDWFCEVWMTSLPSVRTAPESGKVFPSPVDRTTLMEQYPTLSGLLLKICNENYVHPATGKLGILVQTYWGDAKAIETRRASGQQFMQRIYAALGRLF